jgi:hypothetical protein
VQNDKQIHFLAKRYDCQFKVQYKNNVFSFLKLLFSCCPSILVYSGGCAGIGDGRGGGFHVGLTKGYIVI